MILEALYADSPVPSFLEELCAGGTPTFERFFLGELPLRQFAGAAPEVLLVDLLRIFGNREGFADAIDARLAEVLRNIGQPSLASHPRLGTLVARIARVVGSDEALTQSGQAAADLHFSRLGEGLELLVRGEAEDPVLELRRAMVTHERRTLADRADELRRLWLRSLSMPTSEPWYRARTAIMGLARLDQPTSYPESAARAFGRWAQSLDRFVGEGWLNGERAHFEFGAAARDLLAAFRPFEAQIGLIWDFDERIKEEYRRAMPPAASLSKPKRVQPAVPNLVPLGRVQEVAQSLWQPTPEMTHEAQRILDERQRYADITGDTSFLVKTATYFSSSIRDSDGALAEHWARLALEYAPEDVVGWNTFAEALGRQEDHKAAIQVYLRAIERFPENVVSRAGLGHTLNLLGRFEEAERVYRDTVERFPENVVSRAGLGQTLNLLGRYEEAEEVYRSLLPFKSNNAVWMGWQWSTNLKDGKESHQHFLGNFMSQRSDRSSPKSLSDDDLEVLLANAPLIRSLVRSQGFASVEEGREKIRRSLASLAEAVVAESGAVAVAVGVEQDGARIEDAERILREAAGRYPGSLRILFAWWCARIELARRAHQGMLQLDVSRFERLSPSLRPVAMVVTAEVAALLEDGEAKDIAFRRLGRWFEKDRGDATELRQVLREDVFTSENRDDGPASVASAFDANWTKIRKAALTTLVARTARYEAI